jgi:hypothetical protein
MRLWDAVGGGCLTARQGRTMTVKLYWLFNSFTPMITVPRFAALPAL